MSDTLTASDHLICPSDLRCLLRVRYSMALGHNTQNSSYRISHGLPYGLAVSLNSTAATVEIVTSFKWAFWLYFSSFHGCQEVPLVLGVVLSVLFLWIRVCKVCRRSIFLLHNGRRMRAKSKPIVCYRFMAYQNSDCTMVSWATFTVLLPVNICHLAKNLPALCLSHTLQNKKQNLVWSWHLLFLLIFSIHTLQAVSIKAHLAATSHQNTESIWYTITL